jgi:hypothetical protein
MNQTQTPKLIIDKTPTYTWIKYANNPRGWDMDDSPIGKTYVGLAYNQSSPIAINVPGVYIWTLFKSS